MTEILALFVPWVAYVAMLFAFLYWDESRLPEEQLARAWPPASRAIAVVYFTILAVPIHFARTRRSFVGTLQGLLWGALLVGLDELVGLGVETIANHVAPS